ncbi:MAG: hypothetical protein AB1630_12120 [bacterium]
MRIEEADLLCDRVAILVKGKILVTDTPLNLKAKTDKKSLEEAFMKITGLEPGVLAIENCLLLNTVDGLRISFLGGSDKMILSYTLILIGFLLLFIVPAVNLLRKKFE